MSELQDLHGHIEHQAGEISQMRVQMARLQARCRDLEDKVRRLEYARRS